MDSPLQFFQILDHQAVAAFVIIIIKKIIIQIIQIIFYHLQWAMLPTLDVTVSVIMQIIQIIKWKTTSTCVIQFQILKMDRWNVWNMVATENVAHQYVTKIINFIKNLTANLHIIFACPLKEWIGRLENSFRIVLQLMKFKFLEGSVRPDGKKEEINESVLHVLPECIDLKMIICANCAQKVWSINILFWITYPIR